MSSRQKPALPNGGGSELVVIMPVSSREHRQQARDGRLDAAVRAGQRGVTSLLGELAGFVDAHDTVGLEWSWWLQECIEYGSC